MSHWIDPSLRQQLEGSGTNAYRIYSEGFSRIERYGECLLLGYENESSLSLLKQKYSLFEQNPNVIIHRIFARQITNQPDKRNKPVLITGEPDLPLRFPVQELGWNYWVDFGVGYSVGIFIDQRENRRFLSHLSIRSLLNCFAYTCSFSIVAAAKGAVTTSVDISKKALLWGQENFSLNGLDYRLHRFITDNVSKVLPRLKRQGKKFDVVVLDPPTFSRDPKGECFQVEQDLYPLIQESMELVESNGYLLISTNYRKLNVPQLFQWGLAAAKEKHRKIRLIAGKPALDIPLNDQSHTLWIQFLD